MKDIAIIFIIFFLCVLVLLHFHKKPNKNIKSVADEPFYIPGVLEKPSAEKELRRVSDITTKMLRDERYFCYNMLKTVWREEYQEYYRLKLERIHIRLSIKQTKK